MSAEIKLAYKEDIEEILNGLSLPQKILPSKLFYDERGSKLFDKICELEEYYPTKTELKIMEDNIEEITSLFEEDSVFIEFGSGSSFKTRLLLEHLDHIAGYVPIDISEEHLYNSTAQLKEDFPGINIYPVAADYTKPLSLPEVVEKKRKKIAYYPGSTIGNFPVGEAKEFLRTIALLVGKNGGLLIGADLIKDTNVLHAAYNDKEGITAEFNLNILRRLNNEFGFNFELDNFIHRAEYNTRHDRIEMHLIAGKNHSFGRNGNSYEIKEGETILTEYSHKYSLDSFNELVSDLFNVAEIWTDEKDYFSVQYLTVK